MSFNADTNQFLHGVRGLMVINNDGVSIPIGTVKDIVMREEGNADFARIMGSRFPQSKETVDKYIRGTIKSMILLPEDDILERFGAPFRAEFDNNTKLTTFTKSDRMVQVSNGTVSAERLLGLMPVVNIIITNLTATDGTDLVREQYGKYEIKEVMFLGGEYNFTHNSFWMSNVEFVANSIVKSNPV